MCEKHSMIITVYFSNSIYQLMFLCYTLNRGIKPWTSEGEHVNNQDHQMADDVYHRLIFQTLF